VGTFLRMRLEEFDYSLPNELIALTPAEPRDHSRLLVAEKDAFSHKHFYDLPDLLSEGDLLVVNNSKVLPARLFGESDGKKFEVLLLAKKSSALHWSCMAKPGKKVREGITLTFPENVTGRLVRADTEWFEIQFQGIAEIDFVNWLFRSGVPPLPPYIKRETKAEDNIRYQTVFAKEPGSVAAPTAGLHFTEDLLKKLSRKGIRIAEVTLHVGYGTFSPIRTPDITDHQMHEEYFAVPKSTWEAIQSTRNSGHRVIAVGTTSLRSLESARPDRLSGWTKLFIRPGYDFQNVDGLLTNFHLPQSSLYVLICSLLGLSRAREVYSTAVREKYRFFSYGDAMLIWT
jgi:S-adenosylmethionine:tRNA ribosyltransferase-isomerase